MPRGFKRYLVGRSVSDIGDSIAPIAITFAVLDITNDAASLGLVLAASMVPTIALLLVGGVAGDRIERRRILVLTDSAMFASQLCAGISLCLGIATLPLLMITQAVRGAAGGLMAPATTGIVADLVKPERRQQGNAILGLSRNTADLVGPAVAGVIAALASPGYAVLVSAAAFALSSVYFARMQPVSGRRDTSGRTFRSDLRDGWRDFASRRWVWTMVASFAVYQATIIPAIIVLGPVLLEDSSSGAAGWAVILTCRAAGALAVGLFLLRWRPRRPLRASTLVLLLDVPFLLTLALGAPLALVAALASVSSAALVAADTYWESALQVAVPSESLSRISSYDWLGSLALNPVGMVVIGVLASLHGAAPVVVVCVAVHVVLRVWMGFAPPIRDFEPHIGVSENDGHADEQATSPSPAS